MPRTLAPFRYRIVQGKLRRLAYDDVTRVDNASSIGNLDSGQTWNVSSAADAGTRTWAVTSGRMTCTSNPTDANCWIETGVSDLVITWKPVTTSASLLVGAYLRRVDASNYLVIRCGVGSSSNVGILRNLAGARGTLFTGSAPIASGVPFVLSVTLAGPLITVRVDGRDAFGGPKNVTDFVTATKHGGYSASSSACSLKNFLAEAA